MSKPATSTTKVVPWSPSVVVVVAVPTAAAAAVGVAADSAIAMCTTSYGPATTTALNVWQISTKS